MIQKKYIYNFQVLLIFILIFPISSQEKIKNFLYLNSDNEITITITLDEIGETFIISEETNIIPDEIYLNGELIATSVKIINLTEIENIVTLKWNSPLKSCENMFMDLDYISEVDLSKFDTSKVTNMAGMFQSCSYLTSLILNNIDTSLVTSMDNMFNFCMSLTSLDLNGFNTSNVKSMKSMFQNCMEIKELHINNFITSSVNDMKGMFNGCRSLTTLDLNNFDTSLVVDMSSMFLNCYSLISLNINNFNTLNVEKMSNMFANCQSLISLNLISFETPKINIRQNLFDLMNKKLVFCTNISISSIIVDEMTFNNSCENICFTENNHKLIVDEETCVLNCSETNYKYEYKGICYDTCPKNTYASSDNIYLCQDSLEGYYLDNDIYKPCYKSCKSCNEGGNEINHNCVECITNYFFLNVTKYNNNCYEKCVYYYYFDSSSIYHCTINNQCPEEQNKLIKNKNKCIDDCSKDDIYIYEENNICIFFIICPIDLPYEKRKECVETCTGLEFLQKECTINNKQNKTAQDNIIKNIQRDISNGNLNSILLDVKEGDKKDYIIYDTDAIYQITSSENQNNYDYNNISSILLGECEQLLKKTFGISDNETLIILKVDIFEEWLKIPIVEYEIYNPITLEKLELDCCKDVKIGISIPVSIDEDSLYKYNSSDDYYNDICFSYTTENGTDIVIKDRQDEFINNNMSLCESKCEYANYNSSNKRTLCECEPKGSISSISEIKSNKDILLSAFRDLKTAVNLDIIKCFKIFLSKDGIIKNIGNYILLMIILIHVVCIIYFLSKGYNTLYNTIQDLVRKKKEMFQKSKKIKKEQKDKNLTLINASNNLDNDEISQYHLKKRKISNPTHIRRNNNKTKTSYDNKLSKCNTKIGLNYSEGKKKNHNKKKTHKVRKEKNNNEINIWNYINNPSMGILRYNDYELNNLSYKEALVIDKRTYFQYYWSLLKQKQLLIFAFYTYNDYNSKIVKISLFFFSFALIYTVNALFFNYNTMHKIYEDQGSFNLIFQIPQIIYSTIISSVINMLIKTLSLSQNNIVEFKKVKEDIDKKLSDLIRCLIIKFLFFFIISSLFLLFFWYYLGCFCAVYINTQEHLIKDTFISFILSLLYPILFNFIPGCFRISSLNAVNKDKECLYKTSKFIHLI